MFLESLDVVTDRREGIIMQATGMEDHKEYQVCATLKTRIEAAVASQATRKRKSRSSPASTATTDMNTTTRLTAVFEVDDGLEEYVVFDDDDAADDDDDAIEVEKQKKQRIGHRTKFPTDILNRNKKYNKPLKQL